MTNFMNADGSGLVGGLNPNGVGQALQLDASGNLQVQDWQRQLAQQGKAFIGNTGLLNSGSGANTYGLSIFNPANSGKTILVYSVRVSSGTASSNSISLLLQTTTINPAYANAATVANTRAGGAASAIASTCTFSSSGLTISPPYLQVEISTGPIDAFNNGGYIILPAGSANGLTALLQTYASGINNITARWLEF
jgi:hypothetical protein